MKAINPRLIYCSMTAFGQDGPRSSQTAYDQVVQATSGLMACTGTPDTNPIKLGAQVLDYATGTMCAFAISSALFQRERTGEGQCIDSSMLDVALILMSSHLTAYLRTGAEPKPRGNDHSFAGNSCYDTADGRVMLGASNRRQHERLGHALDRPELAAQSHNDFREDHRAEQAAEIAEILSGRSAEEWEAYLQDRHVPAARVRTLAEALEDPQLTSRRVTHRHEEAPGIDGPFTVPLAAFKYAHGGPSIEAPPPSLGAQDRK